jgi:hypothetical protein
MTQGNSVEARTITRGDTRTPYGLLLTQSGNPIDLTGLTVAFTFVADDGTVVVNANTSHVTVQPEFTFTVDQANNWIRHNGTPAQKGDQVVFSSTTALPQGLAAGTRYVVLEKPSPNCFRVAETMGGPAIDIKSDGTGTHSYRLIGSVQYAWQDADVAEPGTYWAWFGVTEAGKTDTFPVDGRKRKVVVVEAG